MVGGVIFVAAFSSCSGVRWVHISTVTASSPQATTLHLGLDGCAGNVPTPIVVEDARTIQIDIPLKLDYDNTKACLSSVDATLTSAVGNRTVVDVHQGKSLPAHLSLSIPMPKPAWLPNGWSTRGESGTDGSWTSTYGLTGQPPISVTLATSSHVDQLTGATTVATATVQGRTGSWVTTPYNPAGVALVVADEHWLLMIVGDDSGANRDIITRIANSLSPLPFTTVTSPPVLPPALTGSIAQMRGQTGPATVAGYLVVDASGDGHICDTLLKSGVACADPQLSVEWDGPKSSPPDNLVKHGDVKVSQQPVTLTGLLKDDFLYIET